MILHENRLPADDSHEISCLICYFRKSGKICYCSLLQTIGGALRAIERERERESIALLQSCVYLPLDAVGCSVLFECGISCSYALAFAHLHIG